MDNEPKGLLFVSGKVMLKLIIIPPPSTPQNSKNIFIDGITFVFQYWHISHDVFCANKVSKVYPFQLLKSSV